MPETSADGLQAIQSALASSDVDALVKALRIAHGLITETRKELQETKEELAHLDAELVSIAAANRRTRANSGELKDYERRGEEAREAAVRLAKVYMYFCSPYTGPHLFGQTEPGWIRTNAAVRFDEKFLDNRRIGDFLDLLNCAEDETTKQYIREGYKATAEQFHARTELDRSNMISRGRETALEVFKSIRLLVDADFSDLRTNGSLPTFSRGHGKKTSSKIETLAEYGTDFFTPTCAPCRAHLRQLCELIGVGKNKEGKFVSTPFPPLFYENFDDTAIVGIFGSEPLYRLGRAFIYGSSSVSRLDGLAINKRNPLSKMESVSVTPGFIATVSIVARIILSPDGSFTRDGQGPYTKIDWSQDFDEYIKYLMTVWPTEEGQAIIKRWNQQVFPSIAQQNDAARGSDAAPASLGSQRGGATAAQLLAATFPTVQRQPVTDESYQLPTFRDPNQESAISRPRDKSSSYLYQEPDHYPSFLDPENSSIDFEFDESHGMVLSVPPLAQSSTRRSQPQQVRVPESIITEPAQVNIGGRARQNGDVAANEMSQTTPVAQQNPDVQGQGPQIDMGAPPSRPRPRARLRGSGQQGVNSSESRSNVPVVANPPRTRSTRTAAVALDAGCGADGMPGIREGNDGLADQVSRLTLIENVSPTIVEGDIESGTRGATGARGRGSGRGKRGAGTKRK